MWRLTPVCNLVTIHADATRRRNFVSARTLRQVGEAPACLPGLAKCKTRNDRRSAGGSVPSGEGIVECFRELPPPQSISCRLNRAGAMGVAVGGRKAGGSRPDVGLFVAEFIRRLPLLTRRVAEKALPGSGGNRDLRGPRGPSLTLRVFKSVTALVLNGDRGEACVSRRAGPSMAHGGALTRFCYGCDRCPEERG